jgi:hypothetical protein
VLTNSKNGVIIGHTDSKTGIKARNSEKITETQSERRL